jgi:hypothetical protein
MLVRARLSFCFVIGVGLAVGCSDSDDDPVSGAGGSTGSGGRGGSAGSGSGGSGTGGSGSGGATGQGGSPGSGGSASGGTSGSGGGTGSGGAGSGDSGSGSDTGGAANDGGAGEVGASAPGQGPAAEGRIVFTQDFEQGMTGVTRSPNGLPVDRVQIVDDPKMQRGKVVKIEYQQGDNFRTSPGTEPRSWISAADGYTLKSNTKISVAWGFMTTNPTGATYSFAQIIRSGGPLFMFHIGANGAVRISVNRGSGGGNNLITLQANTWYDFRAEVDYRGGGPLQFFINNKMVATGTGDGGPSDGRWDAGIYWQSGAKSTRTVYVSNVSIGEK